MVAIRPEGYLTGIIGSSGNSLFLHSVYCSQDIFSIPLLTLADDFDLR